MIVHNVLNKLFSAPTSVSVLRELSLRQIGLTGREVARSAKLTPQTAHNALTNLEALKIVKRDFAGRSHYFTLNRDHFLYRKILKTLFENEIEFVSSLYNKIKNAVSKECKSIIVFGSVARKDETSRSDLDICFVYKDKKELEHKVSLLRDLLYNEYGVTLAPYYISQIDFKKKHKNNKSPVEDIVKEGIVIYGLSIQGLIYG